MYINVGNLSLDTDETDLRDAFAPHGEVRSVKVSIDQHSQGFALVEMADGAALRAIQSLNESDLKGRALTVAKGKPPESRSI
jgi:RNA recognition motif-containing protein